MVAQSSEPGGQGARVKSVRRLSKANGWIKLRLILRREEHRRTRRKTLEARERPTTATLLTRVPSFFENQHEATIIAKIAVTRPTLTYFLVVTHATRQAHPPPVAPKDTIHEIYYTFVWLYTSHQTISHGYPTLPPITIYNTLHPAILQNIHFRLA